MDTAEAVRVLRAVADKLEAQTVEPTVEECVALHAVSLLLFATMNDEQKVLFLRQAFGVEGNYMTGETT